jgi:hypothetical protein
VNPFRHLKRATRQLFAAKEGSPFSLALRGRVVAAGAGALRLSVTSVRSYPGGRWLEIDSRPLDIGMPADSAVEDQLARVVSAQRLSTIKNQTRVAVYTAKAKVTRDTLVGAPGALTASRVTSLAP